MYFETDRDKQAYYSRTDNICGAHFHRSAEILYVLSGEKTARLNGEEYILHEGDVLFCLPYDVHSFPPSPQSAQIVAVIPADCFRRFEDYCRARSPEKRKLHDDDGNFLRLIDTLGRAGNEILYEGLINCIFGLYIQRAVFRPAGKTPDRSQAQRIARYIDENYAAELSLSGVAAQFGYSPNYFSALFRKYFRTGFSAYVNSVRVQKSLALLKTQKISSVYFACGFKSPQQYFLNFKKFFACTPYEYLHMQKR